MEGNNHEQELELKLEEAQALVDNIGRLLASLWHLSGATNIHSDRASSLLDCLTDAETELERLKRAFDD